MMMILSKLKAEISGLVEQQIPLDNGDTLIVDLKDIITYVYGD